MKTKNLIILSLFSAISIVLTRFLAFYIPFFGSNDVRISLGDVPIMLAGLIFGPIAGALTGAVSDVIGATMFPAGPFFPGFTLSAMLAGAIPGLLQPFLRRKISYVTIFMTVLLTQLTTSILFNTLWLSMIFGIPFSVLVLPRAAITILMTVIYALIIYALYPRLLKASSQNGLNY
jgi:ECF transporter S component (folate family)